MVGIVDWIHQYVDKNETCIVIADSSIKSNENAGHKLKLKESISSRMGIGTNINNRGSSESQFIYLCVTGFIPTLITILIAWKCNILNLQN